MEELREKFDRIKARRVSLEGYLDVAEKIERLESLESQSSAEGFWQIPPEERNPILKDIRHLHEIVEEWSAFVSDLEELETGLSLLDEEPDSALQAELEGLGCRLESHVSSLELKNLLSGEQDDKNAIVTVHSGAGGTESADWAAMLLRMYSRWAENRGFRMEVLDYQAAEEAGVRSATFSVNGDYAFGYLKTEAGVHRLVRISPFDANKRRHTSFASVFVYPDIDETIEVEIDEGDLQIDTYRAQGAGGQHVNTTDSAVRITHMPTGIVVQCQNQRSQHKNKAAAMKVLRARLYERQQQELQAERDKLNSKKQQIAWGSQIRSYVLHPYQMVKDHRTDVEVGNAQGVLDGAIDPFIEQALLKKVV
ncbi:MAG: peptide chain release factor 2 [SAR324 cluster bacterium]|nr:peptide chain release factor 2 [SAR324 cluster bacterium]